MNTKQVVHEYLISKYRGIKQRMLSAIGQLTDEDINWRPNEESNSIANVVVHIAGNIHQRIEAGFLGHPDRRDRDREFETAIALLKDELISIIEASFAIVEDTLLKTSDEDFFRTQTLRGKQVTLLEIMLEGDAHFSEHLGQILYIAKLRLNEDYISTSIPRKK